MKKLLFLLFTILLSVSAFAQLEVKPGSFKEVPGFVNINSDEDYQFDDNDLPFAVIKVRTENITDRQRRELRFESNLAVGIMLEYKTGEVWVYLTAKYADYLKISHPDFSSTEYTLPLDLQPKKGYEMTLVNKTGMIPEVDVYNYLVVTADQPNAAVYIDDVFEGEQYAQKSFMAGEKHRWRIECELYHTESGEATIPEKEGQNVTIEKTLRPAFGYLNVTSAPESGAIVYIDGKKMGQTPLKSEKLASGEHKVRVMKEMFSAAEGTFTVTDGNTTQANMKMSANFVNVKVTTDSESDIYIDNEKKGTGSWIGRLSDGNHTFEARKASHKTSVENIKLTLGKDENVVIPNPIPIYGTLDVSTNPIGANIIIDGRSFGTTPRVLTNVLIGTHELKLEKTGCATVNRTITLDDKNKLTVNETLPTGKEISISTDGSGDKIFVDGKYIGVSPLTATLSFGSHEVIAIRGYNGSVDALKSGGTDGLNAIKGINGVKAAAKTITVAQNGGTTSVKLAFADGAGNGIFSVSANKKVMFSKGNLQYQASTNTWRFAEHQWDMIGEANRNISSSYSGWIDLFGWGTSGYNGKNPWMTSITDTDYGNGERDIAGTNYDWGVNNTISNGGGYSWRTLTSDEWVYVFDTRSTSSGIRYAKATVNGVNGVILLPDNWSSSNYSLSSTNQSGASFGSNRISQSDWVSKFEAHGAVFLPAAGARNGTGVGGVGSYGDYWSASYHDSNRARSVDFSGGYLNPDNWDDRYYGRSVRLVRSAQ